MKKIFRKFRVKHIDVYIYAMSDYVTFNAPEINYDILTEKLNNKKRFFIKDFDILVHESFLYSKVFLLRSLKKDGPVIGDCYTNKTYRGQSIYPYVINQIAKDAIELHNSEVYVIVNKDNLNSIKGIEKAGFCRYASIEAKRWLWFYMKRHVLMHKKL